MHSTNKPAFTDDKPVERSRIAKSAPLGLLLVMTVPFSISVAAAAYVAVYAPFWKSIPFIVLASLIIPRFSLSYKSK